MDISRKELAVGGSSRPIALHLTDMGCFSVRPFVMAACLLWCLAGM